jgi:hypothetical protein
VTFHLVPTILGDDTSDATHPQQGHQLDFDDPFVTSNNPNAMAGRSRPSSPITQVWAFITLKFIIKFLFI